MVFNALKLSKLLLAVLDIIQNTTYIQTKYNILFYYVIFFFFFWNKQSLDLGNTAENVVSLFY